MDSIVWKITCEERSYPGLWRHWFREQCVAVGWPPQAGYHLQGKSKEHYGWTRARNSLLAIKPDDQILVALHGNRVARVGKVLKLAVSDDLWEPFVPPGPGTPHGEKGRRIHVQWDLVLGPEDRDMVVELPAPRRLSSGELRPTLAKIKSQPFARLAEAMAEPANWVPLWANFNLEHALSGFIAAYPHRLEDGLLPYPNEKLRERVFIDRTRADVLLVDPDKHPVIVECKQHSPTVADVHQLRRYMDRLRDELQIDPRGILVHGGARKLRDEVRAAAAGRPRIQLVQHRVDVGFLPSA
jgi:hypothetical protein